MSGVIVSGSARTIWYPSLNRDGQLPNFSELGEVKEHPTFHKTTGNNGQRGSPQVRSSSDTVPVTRVSCIDLIGSELYV